MPVVPKKWLVVMLVLWLPLQAIAAQMLVCPEGNSGMEIPATDTTMPDHDCCEEPETCLQLDCDQCSQCGLAAGGGAVASACSNRFPSLKQTIAPSQTEILTSCYKDVLFKPPRRS